MTPHGRACAARTRDTCCTTCTKDNIAEIERDFKIKDRLITGQALYERSELIGEQLCNRDVPPQASLFKNISALGPLWRSSKATYDPVRDVYMITGVDFPDHNRTVTSVVEHSGDVFRARMRNDGLVVIRYPGITFRHIDSDGTLYFGKQRIEVRATNFAIFNASFEGVAPGVTFTGSTAARAQVVNVTSPSAEVAVAFLGAEGTGGEFNPFIDVDGVHVAHTTSRRFMAGFARTRGLRQSRAACRRCRERAWLTILLARAERGQVRTGRRSITPPLKAGL